jgi:hypothetical protein
LLERMDTVQALLNSLMGRTDAMSLETREELEKEMATLRIKKTRMKPLAQQMIVLEGVIQRRTSAVAEAGSAIAEAQAKYAVLVCQLQDAKAQFKDVQAAKAKEDAAKIPPMVASAMQSSQHGSLLMQAQGLADMLPPDKMEIFRECLGLLASIAQGCSIGQGAQAAAAMPEDQLVDPLQGVSGSVASSSFVFGVQPNGDQTGTSHATLALQDPYGAAHSPPPTRRGRAKSHEPSPVAGARSRSDGSVSRRLRGKQVFPFPEGDHFSRREAAPISSMRG